MFTIVNDKYGRGEYSNLDDIIYDRRELKMDTFSDIIAQISMMLTSIETDYSKVYDKIKGMQRTGLLTWDEYYNIIGIYFDTGAKLVDGVDNIFKIFEEIEKHKSDHNVEAEKCADL